MAQPHRLEAIRTSLGLSATDLDRRAQVMAGTVRSIERGNRQFKVNETVAAALANALKTRVDEIFHELELSHIGRTTGTGTPLRTSASQARETCPRCFVVKSGSKRCFCD